MSNLSSKEIATIIDGLRALQRSREVTPQDQLTDSQIDALCERLNVCESVDIINPVDPCESDWQQEQEERLRGKVI